MQNKDKGNELIKVDFGEDDYDRFVEGDPSAAGGALLMLFIMICIGALLFISKN